MGLIKRVLDIGRAHYDFGQEQQRLTAEGLSGEAKIISVNDTGSRVDGNPQVDLELEVSLPDREPYTVMHHEVVPPMMMQIYAPGQKHPVKVDPDDQSILIFDFMQLAHTAMQAATNLEAGATRTADP